MNIKNTSFLLLLLLSASHWSYANAMPHYSEGHWLISGDVGAVWPNINSTMAVNNGSGFPAPGYQDLYSASSSRDEGMLAATAGYRWTQHDQTWFPAIELALRYQYLFPQEIAGTVMQYSLPLFENYSYNWKTNANVLSIYTKLDLMQYHRLMPYVDVGLGVSFVHTKNYQESAFLGVAPRTSPAFADQTSTQFSYNVGAGVDFFLFPPLILSLGYDYQSVGNIGSGTGRNRWSGTRLNLGRYGMNTALLSVTYLFDNPFVTHSQK